MKLVTFDQEDGQAIGVVIDDMVAKLDANQPAFRSMRALLDAGPDAMTAARDAAQASMVRRPLADLPLRAPIPRPAQMRDALCFEKHLRQARANRHLFGQAPARVAPEDVDIPQIWYDQPIYYKGNRFAVSGPGDEILWPKGETKLDYELEIAAVIGVGGRDIAEADIHKHIAGYMIFNDFSSRDHQLAEMAGTLGPAKGKDWDTANSMGPWLVTPDEADPAEGLEMVAKVNDEIWSRGNSTTMHHTFARVIAHISRDETLWPGEVIGSGTVGDGCGLELGRFLKPGDRVTLEVEGLGRLCNTIGPMRA